VDLPNHWHPSPTGTPQEFISHENEAPYFGTDLASWPPLNNYGDSNVAQNITIDSTSATKISGTATIPAASLPNGINSTDAEGFYVIRDIHHKGNLYYRAPQCGLSGNHIFPRPPPYEVVTNGLPSTFPASGECWVGYTKITFQSRTNSVLKGVEGSNPWAPFEFDGVTVTAPVKIKLRNYKLSNRTPDPVNFSGLDRTTGRLDAAQARTGVTFDIKDFHQFCPGDGGLANLSRAFQLSGSKDSFIRNIYIEKAIYDIFAAGFWCCDLRLWYGSFTFHPERILNAFPNGGPIHSDGIQGQMMDCTNVRLRGQRHMKQLFWYGDVNNAYIFTNPGGSNIVGARGLGMDYELMLFGGNDPASLGGKAGSPFQISANGSRIFNCWMNDINGNGQDPNNWHNNPEKSSIKGDPKNLVVSNFRYRNGNLHAVYNKTGYKAGMKI
jgi:hypothetical protein